MRKVLDVFAPQSHWKPIAWGFVLWMLFGPGFAPGLLAQVAGLDLTNPADLHDYLGKAKARALQARRDLAKLSRHSAAYGYDATFYQLHLKIDPEHKKIVGNVEIRGRIAPGAGSQVSQIQLDLFDNLTVLSVGGDALDFQQQNNQLLVQITPKIPGHTFSV
ncbi:MAG: hypothetical protein D6814_03675, partial [Calditrichaeota bacterium]